MEIAAGGTATVHLGRIQGAVGFERTVAIKKLRSHLAKDREFVTAFVDEARLASCVHHPNVVQTLDVVEQGDELLLIMEYVEGETLRRLLATAESPVPIPIVAAIVANVLAGLHAAHEAVGPRGAPLRLVHRDVSPENVMVGTDGVARVLDFGVAKASWREQHTQDGVLKGKLAYMSPEQLKWQPLDRRSDLFAVSVTLWEALTGERLFTSSDPDETIRKILSEPLPSPSGQREISSALEAVVMRGLSRAPAERYPTALDMALALERATPLATAREVGAWVSERAATALASRRTAAQRLAHVSEIDESGEVTSVSGVLPSPRIAPSSSTLRPHAHGDASRSRWGWGWGWAAWALVAIGALCAVYLRAKHVEDARSPSAEAAPSPPPSSISPSPPASSAEPPAQPSSVESSSARPTAQESPPSSSSSPSTHRSHGSAGAKPSGPKPPDCTVPYVIGPDGIRRFRPECV